MPWRCSGPVSGAGRRHTQLRVFYLHNFLLGWVSGGLLGDVAAQRAHAATGAGSGRRRALDGGVSLMLAAL
ncbi:MAG: hypothetical protein R3A10_11785 [Caldilineaceae bacterium]